MFRLDDSIRHTSTVSAMGGAHTYEIIPYIYIWYIWNIYGKTHELYNVVYCIMSSIPDDLFPERQNISVLHHLYSGMLFNHC